MKAFKFFALVIGLSVPFWVLGALTKDLTEILPVKLPASALMTVTPLLAAILLTYHEQKAAGVKQLVDSNIRLS